MKKEKDLPDSPATPDGHDVKKIELLDLDFSGYYITSDGHAFRGCKEIKLQKTVEDETVLCIQKNRHKHSFDFAKLVATYFIVNPNKFQHIIFKDFNSENCRIDNLAWVNDDVFFQYCHGAIWQRKGEEIALERDYAIKRCQNIYLQGYYTTLDESLLRICWQKLDRRFAAFPWWNGVHSECHSYFMERARRFSILVKPQTVLWHYAQKIRLKVKNEISPNGSKGQGR